MAHDMGEHQGDERIARVQAMESRMGRARELIDALDPLLDAIEEFAPEAVKLSDYYGSKLWFEDYEASETGEIPPSVQMGVLTQDLPYDVVTEWSALCERMAQVAQRARTN